MAIIPLWVLKRQAIVEALSLHRGKVEEAARALGISRTSVYRSIRDLEIRPEEWRHGEDGPAA